jgi:CubicO group peptidase (beta-lactamase class C family)
MHNGSWGARSAALLGAAAARGVGSLGGWGLQAALILRRPTNEWAFTHMESFFPSEAVSRRGAAVPLPDASAGFDVAYSFEGARYDLDDLHRRTYSTAFVVLHRGRLVHESYPGLFAGPDTRFQLFSVSKSLTSMLLGIAVAEGLVHDRSDPVTRYLPQLRGTAYDGPTIGQLLDMTSGVGGPEDWDDPDSDIIRFVRAIFTGGSLLEVVRSLPRTAEPGAAFNYSTPDAQVLGWALEAAAGCTLAQFAASRIWSRIGAEHDGYYWLTRDHPRTAIGGGSFNATARDVARLGLLMSHDGRVGDQQIVPAGWVAQSWAQEAAHLQVGALGVTGAEHYGYANQWWTLGGDDRAFTGLGIYGQYLYVDPTEDVVVVKCSAWPQEEDDRLDRETISAVQAVVQHLKERAEVP